MVFLSTEEVHLQVRPDGFLGMGEPSVGLTHSSYQLSSWSSLFLSPVSDCNPLLTAWTKLA